MSDQQKKKWIVKDAQGAVQGPYYTDEVIRLIREGHIVGGEKIALFPGTDWFPISRAPEFYDQLLAVLEGLTPSQTEWPERKPKSSANEEQDPSHSSEFMDSESQVPNESTQTKSKGSAQKVNSRSAKPPEEPIDYGPSSAEKMGGDDKSSSQGDVIELKKRKDATKSLKKKKSRKPLFLIVIALLALVAFLFIPTQKPIGQMHLLAPRLGQAPISKSEEVALLKQAVEELALGNFDNYKAAQNKFVKAFEGNNKSAASLSLLCVTYYHLWPFVAQDSQDRRTLTQVTQYVSQMNPTSVESFTCRSIDLMLRGRTEEALSNVNSVIEANRGSASPPTVFYYLKAQITKSKKDYSSVQSYAQAAQQFWSTWTDAYFVEAEALYLAKQPNESLRVLNGLLSRRPDHRASQVLLGVIEAESLRNYERAEQFLQAGLKFEDQIEKSLVAKAYLAMAEIAVAEGDSSTALKNAQKSYAISSTNSRAKSIIVSIGGEESLLQTQRLDRQLLYEGDQLVREGDCLSAQALYKSAFETNPKNSMAAMKAAECLWSLSLTTEAIDWLNKAINSDHKLIDAYVLLADYYSQRFQFAAAAQVLQSAATADSKNYKVFRGLALIELRRRNANGAIAYAERAASLYEADVETYIILARAHIIKENFSKALSSSGKAIELDINHRDAQVVYAESLFGAQGATSAIEHLSRLVELYPLVPDYRFALGQAHLKNQSYTSAIELFNQVRRMEEKPKKALMALGQAFEKKNNFDRALGYYLDAATVDPSDVEPVFKSGMVYLTLNKPIEAKAQFARVLRVNEKYPLANYYLGKAAIVLKTPAQALKHAQAEAQMNPNLADPYILMAEAYDALEQYNLCASQYQKAAKLRPSSSRLYVKMARCYRLAGGLDSSLAMLQVAKRLESGNAAVYRELGLLFQTKGDNMSALESYNQYLILAPNAPDAGQVRQQVDRLSQ